MIRVFPDTGKMMESAAGIFAGVAANAIARRGVFSVALSGGSTSRPLYSLLGSEAFMRRIDWARAHLFWGDERCVPPEDPQSNFNTVRETLLKAVPLPPEHIHRIRGEEAPARAASDYEQELRSFFGADADGKPRTVFDLILLGMGKEGHTASLFPGSRWIGEEKGWVGAEYVQNLSMWRITLTPVVINAARNVVFMVAGKEKADAVRDVLKGPLQQDRLPAQAIKPRKGRLIWFLDEAAAGAIDIKTSGVPRVPSPVPPCRKKR